MNQALKDQSKITYEDCVKEVKKYNSICDFFAHARPYYNKCQNRKWMNSIVKHLRKRKVKKFNWTKQKILKEAFKYKSLRDFKHFSTSAHTYSIKNDLIPILKFNQKAKTIKPKYSQKVRKITKEMCIQKASKYKTRMEFYSKENSYYQYALRNKIMNEVCAHMHKHRISTKNLNENQLIKKALNKFQEVKYWSYFKNTSCYQQLRERNILDKFKTIIGKESVTFEEKKLVKNFILNLKKSYHELNVIAEYTLPKRDGISARIDVFIKFKDGRSLGIEYKAGQKHWSNKELKKQLNKYKRCLRDRKGLIGLFLVSDNGKYGISENDLFKKLNNILN